MYILKTILLWVCVGGIAVAQDSDEDDARREPTVDYTDVEGNALADPTLQAIVAPVCGEKSDGALLQNGAITWGFAGDWPTVTVALPAEFEGGTWRLDGAVHFGGLAVDFQIAEGTIEAGGLVDELVLPPAEAYVAPDIEIVAGQLRVELVLTGKDGARGVVGSDPMWILWPGGPDSDPLVLDPRLDAELAPHGRLDAPAAESVDLEGAIVIGSLQPDLNP